jgi:LysM repeat protein
VLPQRSGKPALHITPEQLQGAPEGTIKHFVKKTDTLIGIAMQYGITKAQLIQANKGLSNDNLYAYYDIKIPIDRDQVTVEAKEPSEEEKLRERNRTLARFRRNQNVGEAEARYYLSEADFDYMKAVKERQLDLEFERRYADKFQTAKPFAEKFVSKRKNM